MPHALIVDDEPDTSETLAMLIATQGFTVATAASLREARRQMVLQEPDILLLDLMLPDGSGMELFRETKALTNTEVVLMTGHASLETSIEALRLGAADYLVKPTHMTQLQGVLSRVTRPSALMAEAADMYAVLEREGHFGPLWGRAAPMREVYDQITRVAGTAATVLVTGESGTGKEVVARTIHDLSRRRGKPFLAVNCGAISPHLIESEIFGHEKGSFTGADRQHHGFFERAAGGTLFLDEITEMPLDLQVKLLRVLESGSFMRVGSSQLQETDVRILAATNRSLEEALLSGKLRDDLLYRLNVFPIHLPALRDRPEDIPAIAEHFLEQICRREGQAKRFSPQALERLSAFRWSGNVRELRNIVYRAYVMATGPTIVNECLPRGVADAGARPTASESVPVLPSITVSVGTTLAEAERQITLATLEHLGRHKEKTAATLGISLKTLYNRLKEYSTAGSVDLAMADIAALDSATDPDR